MTFIWPNALFTLLLLPLVVGVYLRRLRLRRQSQAELGPMVVSDRAGRAVRLRRHLPPMVMMLGLGLLLFGLARPQMMVDLPRVEGTVILAFDVSNSMSADDIKPTRLEAAKAAARSFVEHQPPTIRLGVVAFGGTGLIVQAPTYDQSAVLDAIDRITNQGGTSLGQGIFTSLNAIAGKALSFDQATAQGGASQLKIEDYSSAVVMLFTDGENTDSPDPTQVAQLAADAGVRVYPIGIGSPEGTTITVDGFNIVTQLDEATLQAIAKDTNGTYYPAQDAQDLQDIYKKVNLQLTTRGEQMEITSIVGGVSSLLLLIGAVLALVWYGRVP
jgi:Ca-activated chloride channel family protein